jgi:translation initiation factor IF-1
LQELMHRFVTFLAVYGVIHGFRVAHRFAVRLRARVRVRVRVRGRARLRIRIRVWVSHPNRTR